MLAAQRSRLFSEAVSAHASLGWERHVSFQHLASLLLPAWLPLLVPVLAALAAAACESWRRYNRRRRLIAGGVARLKTD